MKLDMLPHDFIMIPSKSDPSVEHMVKIILNDVYSCDCKGYKYVGKCWHIEQAKKIIKKMEELEIE